MRHRPFRRRLGAKRESRQQVSTHIDRERLDDGQRQWHRKENVGKKRHHLGDVAGEYITDESADIGADGATLLDPGDDRCEVVVSQDDIGRGLGDFSAAQAHGHANIRRAQRRRVVDSVARHHHHFARCAEDADDSEFLFRVDAGDYRVLRKRFAEFPVGHPIDLLAGDRADSVGAHADDVCQ